MVQFSYLLQQLLLEATSGSSYGSAANLSNCYAILLYVNRTQRKKHHSVVEVKVEKEVKRTKQGEREARRQGNSSVQNPI
jgi:hypothetical protein